MASKQQVYRNTLLILKEPAVGVTITDDTRAVNTMGVVYDSAQRFILESGKWNFAARSLSIEAETSVEPAFGYTFAFEKPDDYANLIKLAPHETFYPPFRENQYVDEGNYWFANCDPLYASIVSTGASYGGDLGLWPEVVANALEYEIAFRVAPHLTSMGEQALEQMERPKARALQKAKAWDSSKQPPERPPVGRLAAARFSNGRGSWRG